MKACALFLMALVAGAQGVNFFSPESEAKLGASLAESLLRDRAPTAHAEVREYVQHLAQRMDLAVPLDASGRHFQLQKVAVITGDTQGTFGTHEPAVLPGGYIFVPESLLLAARDEAEFAGMLAHAMAHVTERHATRLLTRSELANTANSSGDGRTVPMSMLVFQREFEREADTLAVRIAATAGFDPQALVRYIDRTQVDSRSKVFSPMPLRSERVEKIQRSIDTLPERHYTSSDEFLEIQKLLR